MTLILKEFPPNYIPLYSVFKSPLKQKAGAGGGALSMKEMRLRLSPLKSAGSSSSSSHTNRGMFGHTEEDEESDTEAASLYHEPYSLLHNNNAGGDTSAPGGGRGKLVKNYSCGRLCDYDDSMLRRHVPNKFGSTPLFLSAAATAATAGGAAADLRPMGGGTTRGKPPPTSHSFTSNMLGYEKDYRRPSFSNGYAVPVSRSKQSLGRALSVPPAVPPPGGENFYAATDIIQVKISIYCKWKTP